MCLFYTFFVDHGYLCGGRVEASLDHSPNYCEPSRSQGGCQLSVLVLRDLDEYPLYSCKYTWNESQHVRFLLFY